MLGKTYLTKEEAVALYRNYIKEHLQRYKYVFDVLLCELNNK